MGECTALKTTLQVTTRRVPHDYGDAFIHPSHDAAQCLCERQLPRLAIEGLRMNCTRRASAWTVWLVSPCPISWPSIQSKYYRHTWRLSLTYIQPPERRTPSAKKATKARKWLASDWSATHLGPAGFKVLKEALELSLLCHQCTEIANQCGC